MTNYILLRFFIIYLLSQYSQWNILIYFFYMFKLIIIVAFITNICNTFFEYVLLCFFMFQHVKSIILNTK